MARIRTIKPTIWGDDKVSDFSFEARLLFIGLISLADDQGRFLASYVAIVGHIFPNDAVTPKQLQKWLEEIVEAGLVVRYDVGRLQYGAIRNWTRHQKINRPQPSTLPPPPESTDRLTEPFTE